MNLIDKQHIALAEIAYDRGQVAGAFDGRSGCNPQIHAEFARNDMSERSLAQAWR